MINVTLKQIQSWIPCEIEDQFLNQEINGVTIEAQQFLKIFYLYHLKVKMLTVIALSLKHYKMVLGLLLSKRDTYR